MIGTPLVFVFFIES